MPYSEVYTRALGILYHLQAMGAQRGDKMIIFLSSNEQFLDGFWAAVCGGIIPVPLAVGISDEHRHEAAARGAQSSASRSCIPMPRIWSAWRRSPPQAGESALFAAAQIARAFWSRSITDISRPGKLYRPAPDDLAFIQFSSGSTSEPKGVMLTHGNLIANTQGSTAVDRFSDQDVTLSWMPLTHDMGLIGFYLMQFANRVAHPSDADRTVRAPAAAVAAGRLEEARHHHLFAQFRLPAFLEGAGRAAPRGRGSVERYA